MLAAIVTAFLPTIVRVVGDILNRKNATDAERQLFIDFVKVMQKYGMLPADMKMDYDSQGPSTPPAA